MESNGMIFSMVTLDQTTYAFGYGNEYGGEIYFKKKSFIIRRFGERIFSFGADK